MRNGVVHLNSSTSTLEIKVQTTPQNSITTALFLAFELGGSNWKLGFATQPAGRVRCRNLPVKRLNPAEILQEVYAEVAAAKLRLGLAADAPVYSCYEAGRDGFWLDRALSAAGVTNVIVEPASLLVDRRARRAKTDQLDLKALLSSLFRHHAGEKVWRVVRVPSAEDEDLRRLPRERELLVKQRGQHTNRIGSYLVLEGIHRLEARVLSPRFEESLGRLRRFDGSPLPNRMLRVIKDEIARLRLVQAQIKSIDDEQKKLLKAEQPTGSTLEKARRLTELKGIGPVGAMILTTEFYGWREFKNRGQVGALAGLTDTPWKSDGIDRPQGISKAGNYRIRRLAVELAWGWVTKWQVESELSKWYRRQTESGKKRLKRVAIVAVARKLLVALWHYLDHGVLPTGAILKPSRGLVTAKAKPA